MKIPHLEFDRTTLGEKIANQKSYKVGGLRKRKVYELFKKQGPEAAWTLGLKLRLKQGTLRTWFEQWKTNGNDTRTR
jgi:hypothetical protein